MSFAGPDKHQRKPQLLAFHPQCADEYNINANISQHVVQQAGIRPQYREYSCGSCGSNTTGRILCDITRTRDGTTVQWCICACDRQEPAIVVSKDGVDVMQLPQPKQFHSDPKWPTDLATLYEEASKSYSAGAYTSASMVCRKILMACACHEQAKAGETVQEGKRFIEYVDYLADKVLAFPAAKKPIDVIRDIGNDANHHVTFVNQPDAERSMKIVHHMLNTIYTFPEA